MSKQSVLMSALMVALLMSGVAVAADRIVVATLGEVNGKVLVNTGNGYAVAKPGMSIAQGDRLIALDSSSAKIVYADGCITDLKENNLIGVEGKTCTAKPVNPRSNGTIRLAQAIGGTVDAGTPGMGGVGGAGSLAWFPPAAFVTSLALGALTEDDDKPISNR